MKRMTYFVMALALVLGLAQCKKEQPVEPTSEGNGVHITLDVNGGSNKGTRVNVDPNSNQMVTFEEGDKIHVISNGLDVGTLIHDGTNFSGDIENATIGQPLFFYFFGNISPQYFDEHSKYGCSVYIGDQTGNLPVISMGASIDRSHNNDTVYFSEAVNHYEAQLHNKCSLMKFNVTTTSDTTICINGMNNFIKVNFSNAANDGEHNGFSYEQQYDGLIEMAGLTDGNTETWAIVLPQGHVAEGNAWTKDGYIGTRPAIEGIEANKYYSAGVDMTLLPHDPLSIPLTFEAMTAGATVTLNGEGNAPSVSLETSTDGITWTPYEVGTTITLTNVGDKLMFHGTNKQYATSPSDYHYFSLDDDCYVYGNIMSLISATGYATLKKLDSSVQYTFESLFYGCEGLNNHPDMTIELPATDLAPYCYSHMFKDCTFLTVAPELPADDFLKYGCYQGMFEYCDALEESPVLPAERLVQSCYAYMFNGCSSLGRVTCLATSGINQNNSTSSWLSGVADGGTFIKAASASVGSGPSYRFWPEDSENGIPSGWTVEQ